MQSIIITGVDTVLGSNLALEFARWFNVFGMYQSIAVEVEGCRTGKQPEDTDELLARIDQIAPRWVIHCGAVSQSSWDDVDTPHDDVAVVQSLLAGSHEMGYRLSVFSSDAVFTGPRMFHAEDDPRLGTGALARGARHIEQLLEGTSALVVRTHAYGWSPAPDFVPGIDRLWDCLRFSSECRLETKRHATPILASDLAPLLCRAMDRELTGLYHIAGAERTNAYRFGVELAASLGLTGHRVSCLAEWHRDSSLRVPVEMSLDTHRACAALNTSMPLVRDGLRRLVEQAEQGIPSRLRAAEQVPAAA